MIEIKGNIWDRPGVIIIPTNGHVSGNGKAVMGRGLALQAARRYPLLAKEFGDRLTYFGKSIHFFPKYNLMTFPVKHHWNEKADFALIKDSIKALRFMISNMETYNMPRVGCGNGGLKWEDVKPLLIDLPNNVFVVDLKD
jgi:hypothetical protein